MSDAVSRADTQYQLNGILDPIGARLPVEILSEIFILCLPDSGDRHPNSTTAPLLLLRICSVWANIARSTPVLWDTLRVEFPRAKGFEHLFDSYLARVQRRGLALTLDNCDGDSLEMLRAHVHRMQQPGSALLATSVNLKALRFSQPCFLYLCEVLSMLRATPGLIECTLIDACHDDPYEDSLTLPCLQSLSLGEDEHVCDVYILKYLSLPTLHTLSISYTRTDKNEAILTSFLTRLEAPLRSLRVEVSDTMLQSEAYIRLLGLVPTLTCLWLTWESTSECMLISNLLRRSPQGFLAQLRDLTFFTRNHDASDFQPLYDLLSARHSQMKSFRFFIDEGYNRPYLPPPPNVLHRLRQLAAECGMKIHFGTMDKNYI